MFLVPQKETKKEHYAVFVEEPIAANDTSIDESVVESKEDTIESHEENSEAGNIQEEEFEELHDSKDSHVMK